MPELKKTKNGWVAIRYFLGYDDEWHPDVSPPFQTKNDAEKYLIDEMGAPKCDFCNHFATRHYNMFGQSLDFNSQALYGDYYTCDACTPKVKEDIEWRRGEREKKLKENLIRRSVKKTKRKSIKNKRGR